jgi:hypothetical protein
MINRLYFFLERLFLFVHNSAAALVQGVALGLVSNEKLEQLTQQRYSTDVSLASFADESYVNSGLLLWEREAIFKYFPPAGRVLVGAAGAGREMVALAAEGFFVEGFDCCKPLVELAQVELKRHGIDSNLYYTSPSTVPECNGPYSAALVGFSGYMYIAGSDRRIRFLQELCKLLKPDAPVMISFTEGSHGRKRVWTAKIGTFIRSIWRAPPVEEGDCIKNGFQHHFVRQQIVSEMNAAGLEMAYYSAGTCYGHAVGLVRDVGKPKPNSGVL